MGGSPILVTGAEQLIALSVIRSLGKNGLSVHACSFKPNAMSFKSRHVDRHFTYPDPSDSPDDAVERILEETEKEDYEMVMVGGPDLLDILSERRMDFEGLVMIPLADTDVIKTANNKEKIFRFAQEKDFPIPATYYGYSDGVRDAILEDGGFPLIVKPQTGAGSRGVSVAESIGELDGIVSQYFKRAWTPVIQQVIFGEKVSFSGLFNRDSQMRRTCIYKALREYPIAGGPLCAGVTVQNNPVLDAGNEILSTLGWFGVANIEFIVDERDGIPKMIDLNPRFFGGLPLTIAAGVDYPNDFRKMVLDGDIEEKLDYRIGATARDMLVGDLHFLLGILRGESSAKYAPSRTRAIADYLKGWFFDADFIMSMGDPVPGFYEALQMFKRRFRPSGSQDLSISHP